MEPGAQYDILFDDAAPSPSAFGSLSMFETEFRVANPCSSA
jgi:hypothetical protein